MRGATLALAVLLLLPLALAQDNATDLSLVRYKKWEFVTRNFIDSSPSTGEGMIFIGSADGSLYAVDAVTGRQRWSFLTGGRVESSPFYKDGVVYFGSNDNATYALNATTGEKLWQFNSSGKVLAGPAVTGGIVYTASADGSLYALNATEGAYLWEFKTDGSLFSSPEVFAGIVYVGSDNGVMYAVNASTGELIWEFATGGPIYSSPRAANNIVYFGSYDTRIYALDAFNGSLLWNFTTNDKVISSPAVARGILWAGSTDGRVYALNAFNGQLLWSYETGDSIESSPTYVEYSNALYIGSNDNNLYALNALNGQLLWKFQTRNWVVSRPLHLNGVVYFGSYDKKLYAVSTIASNIIYPESGQEVNGTTVTIRGKSFADAGVKLVEIRIGADPTWRSVVGTSDWSYTWSIANLRPTSYLISVRTTDNHGDVELPPYRQISVEISQPVHAFDKPMVVIFPERLRPGDWVRIEVRDEQGRPIPFVKVTMDGQTYYGDENGVVSRDVNGNPIVVTKQEGELLFEVTKTGYFVPEGTRLAIRVQKEDYTPYLAAGALVVIVAIALYIWKKRQEPSYV
mgnify:CR=1 FL=1